MKLFKIGTILQIVYFACCMLFRALQRGCIKVTEYQKDAHASFFNILSSLPP